MGSHTTGDAEDKCRRMPAYRGCKSVLHNRTYLPAEGAPWFFVKRPNGLAGDHVEYIRKPEQMAELFAFYGLEMPEKLLLEADELTYNDYIRLQKIFNPKETGNATAMMRALRRIKTPYEIAMFRISAERLAKTYAELPECYRPG